MSRFSYFRTGLPEHFEIPSSTINQTTEYRGKQRTIKVKSCVVTHLKQFYFYPSHELPGEPQTIQPK